MSDLGEARGRIVISTNDLRRATQEVQSASRTMEQAFRAVGVAVGLAEFGRFVVEADRLATSYARQSVAARQLAGSQGQLNDLLNVYDRATGGAIDKATSLGNVTQLLAVGFADSTEELDQFARAIRGISVAMGRSQDFVTQNLVLELFSQRGMRLDQLGLQYDLVRKRADELAAADRNLTQQAAYQLAVLEQAEQRFGALTRSAEAQATGIEKLRKAWADFQLEFGEDAGPGVNIIFEQWADDIERARRELEIFSNFLAQVAEFGQQFRFDIGLGDFNPRAARQSAIGRFERDAFLNPGARTQIAPPTSLNAEQQAEADRFSREIQNIERQANRDRLDATRQFEQQRSDTIRQYEKTIAREAQDFAIGRARAEEDYALGLQRMHRDIAQREARQLEDLERTIADARTDAAERGAQRQADLDERIAENRAASQERILELEADFAKRQERAQRSHARSLRDAVANLDAVRLRELQQDYRESQQEAQEDFDERLDKERKNEAKRLADLEKAHAKQTASEGAALEKRIRQANEAYQRQIEDARAADAQRIEDIAADFALRQERENADRALRLERLAQDHNDQLAEQARQHALRLAQIHVHAQEERTALELEHKERMIELGVQNDAWLAELERMERERRRIYDEVWGDTMRGHPSTADPYIDRLLPSSLSSPAVAPRSITNSSSRTSSISGVNINVFATPNQSPFDIANEVNEQFALLLERYANQ